MREEFNSLYENCSKDGITEEEAKRLCEEIINLQQMNSEIYTRIGKGRDAIAIYNAYPNSTGYTNRRVELIGEDGISGILGNMIKIFGNDYYYWSKAYDELQEFIPEEEKASVIPY